MAAASIRKHNQTVLDSLEEGDMVEFPNCLYSHWAVYVGNEEVVHLTGDLNTSSVLKSSSNVSSSGVFVTSGKKITKAKVKLEKFFDAAGNSKARKNNDKDNKVSPSDKKMIVQRALSRTGENGYNIFWRNCEHFASWCRYGEGWSEQVSDTLVAVGGIVLTVAVVGAAALLYYFFRRKKEGN